MPMPMPTVPTTSSTTAATAATAARTPPPTPPPLPSTPTPPADADADSARPSRCCRRPPSTAPPVAAPGRAPPPRPTLRLRFHQCCDAADASPPGRHGSVVRTPSLSWFSLCLVCGATVECRRGVSMCAACGHRHLATCVCSCNMMIAQVTHALLAPGAGRPTVLHSRQGRGRAAAVERFESPRSRASSAEIIATWPYAPAGGMARKTTHERYLGHRRSSQSEELTTRTCIAPARCAPRK